MHQRSEIPGLVYVCDLGGNICVVSMEEIEVGLFSNYFVHLEHWQ